MPSDEEKRLLGELKDALETPLHERITGWVRANGVNPNDVSTALRPTIADGELTFARFIRNPEGRIQVDPLNDEVVTETVTVPIVVEPGAEVAALFSPRCAECGR